MMTRILASLALMASATLASADALTLPDTVSHDWIKEQLAAEGEVRLYFPGGSNFRRWQADVLVPSFEAHIKETYGVEVKLNLLPTGGGTPGFWQRYEAFNNAGGTGEFDVDVARVAPDFRTFDGIEAGWMLPILPDYAALTPNLADVTKTGMATFEFDGANYGIPLYQPTQSMFYNTSVMETPPVSLEELKAWIIANPERFTYVDPRNDGGNNSGTQLLMTVMNHFGDLNDPSTWEEGWKYVEEIHEYIYPNPNSGEQALELMRRGEIHMLPFWNDWGVFFSRDANVPFMKNYYIESGMPIRNTPIAIPTAAPHPVAALLLVDFMLSPAMQSDIGQRMGQIPANMGDATWSNISDDAFGLTFDQISKSTFPAWNSRENVNAIRALYQTWDERIARR